MAELMAMAHSQGHGAVSQGRPGRPPACLAEGQIELVEIGVMPEPGKILGEIAFFGPDNRRTHTARCASASTVLMVDEVTLKQLTFQNPSFGFHLIGLAAGRLSQDVRRIESRFAGTQPAVPPQH